MEYIQARDAVVQRRYPPESVDPKCLLHLFTKHLQNSLWTRTVHKSMHEGGTWYDSTGQLTKLLFNPRPNELVDITRQNSQTPLLRLPAELRVQILEHVLVDRSLPIAITSEDDCATLAGEAVHSRVRTLWSCKQFMREGLPIFFGENIFVYGVRAGTHFTGHKPPRHGPLVHFPTDSVPLNLPQIDSVDVVHIVSGRSWCLQLLRHLCVFVEDDHDFRHLFDKLSQISVSLQTLFVAWGADDAYFSISSYISRLWRLCDSNRVRSLHIRAVNAHGTWPQSNIFELRNLHMLDSTGLTLSKCGTDMGLRLEKWTDRDEVVPWYELTVHDFSGLFHFSKLLSKVALLPMAAMLDAMDEDSYKDWWDPETFAWRHDEKLWALWNSGTELADDELDDYECSGAYNDDLAVFMNFRWVRVWKDEYEIYRNLTIGFLLLEQALKKGQTKITDYFSTHPK